jgi:hypothetical protein
MHCLPSSRRALSLALLAVTALVLAAGLASAAEKNTKAKRKPSATPAPATASLPSGTQLSPAELARHIDAAIDARLAAEKAPAAAVADDAEFLRRAYLDIAGHIPPAERVVAFLDDRDANKRVKLIDELLASEDYGKRQADIWQALLLPRSSDNRAVRFDAMTKWLEDSFNANKPWDKMVRELVTAAGDAEESPTVAYVLANRGPDKLTDSVTRLFLGVQLQCAQCHNHPFTAWKQDEYWGMAAFFSKVRLQGNPRPAAQRGGTVTITEGNMGRPLPRPDSAKTVPAKFLQGEQANLTGDGSARKVLADWMTSPRNRYFGKAMVNRTWAQFFGRGIVMPVDDMHDGNIPSHPQLLADLAEQFAASGFDVKYLIRGVCNSKAYQRTSKVAAETAGAAPELFSRMAVKVQAPEQLYDSLVQVLGGPPQLNQQRRNPMMRLGPQTPRQAFVNFFKIEDADPTEYQVGIPQALRLMNSPQMNNANMLTGLLSGGKSAPEVIEQLYLKTLSRRPTREELNRLTEYAARSGGQPRAAYADMLWALINSSEFAFNH